MYKQKTMMMYLSKFRGVKLIIFSVVMLASCSHIEDGIYNGLRHSTYWLTGLEQHDLNLSDHKIHYMMTKPKANVDNSTLVFVHGFATNKDSWLQVATQLRHKFQVIILDLPGHGQSEKNIHSSYTIAQQSERLAEFIDALGIQSLHLIGHSMGGAIAIHYAAQHPERLRTLALLNPAVVTATHNSQFFESLGNGENPLIVKSDKEFATFMDLITYKKPFIPWPIGSSLSRQMQQHWELNQKIFSDIIISGEALSAAQFTEMLTSLTMPVLLLWGKHDDVLDVSNSELFSAHVPNIDIIILDNVGHSPIIEAPRRVAKLYTKFLLGEET